MIKPIKVYYVTSKDETTIIYKEIVRNKEEEKLVTFKGRYFHKVRPTEDNILNKLKEVLLK